MFFTWLRRKVAESFMAGVADAVNELTNGDENGEAVAIATLRLRLAPPPVEEEAIKPKKVKA